MNSGLGSGIDSGMTSGVDSGIGSRMDSGRELPRRNKDTKRSKI